jgi:hypothetical protein
MTIEQLREKYEQETKQRWWTNPVSHGEIAFASWEYQLWLENKLSAAERELKFLNCLRAAGVDNWEGYDVALDMHAEE